MDPAADAEDLAWSALPEACRLSLLDLARREAGVDDRALTLRQIAEATGIPKSSLSLSERRALLRLRRRAKERGL